MSSSKNAYVIDSEQPTETARLIEQSKLFTQAMGGLFPDDLDISGVRRVLDLGCGPGQWAGDVAFLYPEWEVLGVDINATMIRYAHAIARSQGRPNISFEVMDITEPFAFADASFYECTYQSMLVETHQPDFRCLAFGVSAWGSKPKEEVE